MAELPTKEDLEKLYHEKGRDALVWYAWRNSLRALPILGLQPLHETWNTNTVNHLYAVCRIPIILGYTECLNPLDKPINNYVPAYVNVAVSDVAIAFRQINIARDGIIANAIKTNVEALAVSQLVDIDSNSAVRAAYRASQAAHFSIKNIAAIETAQFDYSWCLQYHDSVKLFFKSPDLWGNKENNDNEIAKRSLISQLKEYELGFLSDDLVSLWTRGKTGEQASSYIKNFSESITSDASLLCRVIQGEAVDTINATRVFLLGSAGSGKSSLAERLQGKSYSQFRNMDLDIYVNYRQYEPLALSQVFPSLGLNDNDLDLFLWDFSGQTIFHGIHGAFLHENCVFVLVVDGRHEQTADEWLHQIRHLVGSKAKVLLVTNLYEKRKIKQNEMRLLRKFPDLLIKESFHYFSCIKDDDQEFFDFIRILTKIATASQRVTLKEILDIKSALDSEYGDSLFLREKEIIQLISRKDRENIDLCLRQLQQLGFILKTGRGKSRYCIKPSWLIDKAHYLLSSDGLQKSNGIQCLNELEDIFDDGYGIDEKHLGYLIDFLQEGNLCHLLSINDGSYYFPDASNSNEPELVGRLLAKQARLILHFDLPYLPLGFHARLVHELFKPNHLGCIDKIDSIWRQGFILRTSDTQAVVQYLLRKSSIEMVLVGEKLNDYADLLRVFYTHLHMVIANSNGIKPHEIHPSVRFDNGQLFSVHSSAELIDVLKTVKDFKTLITEVGKMAGKVNIINSTITDSQISSDNSKNHSDNLTITITADQRQIISTVLDEMLEHKLPKDITKAVVKMQDVVEADAEQPTEKTQSLLSRFIGGVKQIAGFTDDASKIDEFVAKHQDDIGAVLTSIQSSL